MSLLMNELVGCRVMAELLRTGHTIGSATLVPYISSVAVNGVALRVARFGMVAICLPFLSAPGLIRGSQWNSRRFSDVLRRRSPVPIPKSE